MPNKIKIKKFVFINILFIFVYGFGMLCIENDALALSNEMKISGKTTFGADIRYNNDSSNCRSIIVLRKSSDAVMLPDVKKSYKIQSKKIVLGELKPLEDTSRNYVIFDYYGKVDSQKITITDLLNGTKYSLDLYKIFDNNTFKSVDELRTTYSFTTLSLEPTVQAYQLAFKDNESGKLTLRWTNGNGNGRLVLIRKDSVPEFPSDGRDYFVNPVYGTDSARIGRETYAVFKTSKSDEKSVTVTNLPFGIYYFHVFEYNGNGESVNYLTSSGKLNPRERRTRISPPTALDASSINPDGFTANWTRVEGTEFYEVDLSFDSKFNNFLDGYKAADVGDMNNFEITGLEKKKVYYYRVRAVHRDGKSENSNTIKVQLK